MSNAASTWIGLIAGAAIGGIITWWVYNRQNKTSKSQKDIIDNIDKMVKAVKSQENKQEGIVENIDKMVKAMKIQEDMQRAHQDEVLNKILSLDSKIDSILEKKGK